MDDDDEIEIQSHATPSPSPPNGRITVTVASTAVSAPPLPNNSLSLVTIPEPIPIQIQQPPQKPSGGGREDCWSEGATAVLIEAWGERYLELSRGNLKQKHWKEVADIVSSREDYTKSAKTDIQCKNRIDTVKKKYKLEKGRIAAGGGSSKWPFFERLDRLIGPISKNVVNNSNYSRAIASASISKVPVGIPVGRVSNLTPPSSNIYQKVQIKSGSSNNNNNIRVVRSNNSNVRGHVRKRSEFDTESDSEDEDENYYQDSEDSLPPPQRQREKRSRVVQRSVNLKGGKERKGWGNSIRMLTQAMLKFGEAYEQAESAKLQQVVEMEKARMKFAKELELQRMQFFMKTQMEISQLKPCRRGGGGSNLRSGNNNNNNSNVVMNNNINSDSDN